MNAVRQTLLQSLILQLLGRLPAFIRVVLLSGLATFVCCVAATLVQADPPNKSPGPIHPAQAPASPRSPAPSWSEFKGNFLISVEQETHPPAKPTLKTFNGRN